MQMVNYIFFLNQAKEKSMLELQISYELTNLFLKIASQRFPRRSQN